MQHVVFYNVLAICVNILRYLISCPILSCAHTLIILLHCTLYSVHALHSNTCLVQMRAMAIYLICRAPIKMCVRVRAVKMRRAAKLKSAAPTKDVAGLLV